MVPRRCKQLRGRCLEHRTKVRVRFHEVDGLHVVWHGHYLVYFEDARVAFGKRYGIDYQDIFNAGLMTPVVEVSCHYLQPASYNDELEVVARMFDCESAKIVFGFEVIRSSDGTLLATGTSVQAFMNLDRELLITQPQFMQAFYEKWRNEMVEFSG